MNFKTKWDIRGKNEYKTWINGTVVIKTRWN